MSSVIHRTQAHRTAAVLNLIVSLFGIAFTLPILPDGATATDAAGDQPPFAIIILAFTLGVIGIISSYGVWKGQRWGVVLTIIVNALSFLSGVPGCVFAPTTFLLVSSWIGCALNIVIIYLLLRRRRMPVALGGAN